MQLFRSCSTLVGRRQFNSQKHGTLVMTRYKADTTRRLSYAGPYLDGILIGSTIGGFIPNLWGAGLFSYSSVLLSGFGAVVGLLIGYKLA